MAQGQDKDFLDIDLDDPLDGAEEIVLAAPARSTAPVGAGVLLFDNKKYAVGLKWLIADDEGDTDLALKRAKGFKADFYGMRQNVAVQHGFGFLSQGHRIGMSMLASMAADVLVGEWHGVFVADNGWWYLAVHADNIAPDGDLFFASEEEAYNHFIKQSEGYRWPRGYAPESWNLPDASGEISISKILAGEVSAPSLKPVTLDAIFSGKRNKNLAVGAGVIIVLLLAVSVIGQQILPSLVPQQAQVPVPNVQVSDTLQAPPKETMMLGEKAEDSLTAMALVQPSKQMEACIGGFSNISVPLPGWRLDKLRCKDTFVEGTWMRQTGSYDLVEPYLSRFPEGVTRVFSDSATLVATRRLTGKRETMQNTDLLERNRAIILLNKRFGNLGNLDVKDVSPAASQQLLQGIDAMQQAGFSAGMGQNKQTIQPLTRDDLPFLAITLKTQTPPNMIGRYFDLPGMIVLSLSSNVPDGGWQYDVKLITRPDQRLIEANAKARAMQIQ